MKLLKLIPDNTNIKFLRWRVPFYVVSLLLMAASITLVATKGLNLGVDFVGGQQVRATFAEDVAPIAEVREEIDALGYGEPTIQQIGAPNRISIRMRLPDTADLSLSERMVGEIRATLQENHPGVTIGAAESVSGKVSEELFEKGILALIFASIGISIYIWVRFEWQFGVGALFALVHDVTLTLGMFSLTQMEFDLNIVASLLTLIGYSLNDNIVIYDRIREERARGRKVVAAVEAGYKEASRAIYDANITNTIAAVLMFIFGSGPVRGFAVVLIIGIVTSVFTAVTLTRMWVAGWLRRTRPNDIVL